MCAKRYRNRTGLSYHYTHSHLAEEERPGERSAVPRTPSVQQTDRQKRKNMGSCIKQNAIYIIPILLFVVGPKGPGVANIPNNYCNKCHGSKKTGKSVSPCSVCRCLSELKRITHILLVYFRRQIQGGVVDCCSCVLPPADCGDEKEDGNFTGAEELFGTTSESDTSTFHGFEDDELEEPTANSNGISSRHR